jgi:hypothetical protein
MDAREIGTQQPIDPSIDMFSSVNPVERYISYIPDDLDPSRFLDPHLGAEEFAMLLDKCPGLTQMSESP